MSKNYPLTLQFEHNSYDLCCVGKFDLEAGVLLKAMKIPFESNGRTGVITIKFMPMLGIKEARTYFVEVEANEGEKFQVRFKPDLGVDESRYTVTANWDNEPRTRDYGVRLRIGNIQVTPVRMEHLREAIKHDQHTVPLAMYNRITTNWYLKGDVMCGGLRHA